MFTKTVHTPIRPPSGSYLYVPETPPKRPPLPIQALGVLLRLSWRHRWPLTPAWGALVVLAVGRSDPFGTLVGLWFVGGAMGVWAWVGRRGPGDPRVLSIRERRLAAAWCGLALPWCLWSLFMPSVAPGLAAVVLALLVAVPSVKWARSRIVRPRLSPAARVMADAWARELGGSWGPDALRGSVVEEDSWEEPADGAHTFLVRLAPGGHGRKAATKALRQDVESLLGLPTETVELAAVREDAKLLRVTLAPARHLEAAPAVWPGPVLRDDGMIPLAVAPDGREIAVPLWNNDGVEHFVIFGTTGTGKSRTFAAMALPGAKAGVETLWIIDGGRGSSVPSLEPACDWYATRPEQWAAALDAAHAILVARKARRGAAGIHRWRGPEIEEDPVLLVGIEEAATVKAELGQRYEDIVLEIDREGRKLGIRTGQVAIDPAGDGLLGGRRARELASTVIAHRPGGAQAGRMSVDMTTDVEVDLQALPSEPGFVAIVNKSRLLAAVCRVLFAKESAVKREALEVEVRSLVDGDLAAGGEGYARRGEVSPGVPAGATVVAEGVVVGASDGHVSLTKAAEEKRTGRQLVVDILAAQPGPVTKAQLVDLSGVSTSTVQRALSDLQTNGLADTVNKGVNKGLWQMNTQVTGVEVGS